MGKCQQIAVQNRLRFMQFLDKPNGRAERFDEKPEQPAIVCFVPWMTGVATVHSAFVRSIVMAGSTAASSQVTAVP